LDEWIARYKRENLSVCPDCGRAWAKSTRACACGYAFLPVPAESQQEWRVSYWPAIYDLDSAKKTARIGAHVCFLMAGLTGLLAVLSLLNIARIINASSLIDAIMVMSFGFLILRMSRIAAISALVHFLAGRIYAGLAYGLDAALGVFSILLLLGFISGVRGTFAYHRYAPPKSS
jgi:hypothetical protein